MADADKDAAEAGCVIFKRGQDDSDQDIWDDTALIKAYDSAVNKMKEHISGKSQDQELAEAQSANSDAAVNKTKKNKRKKKSKRKKSQWQVGDRCQAIYSEDRLVYEAIILTIDHDAGTCRVRYLGYGNEEDQLLSDLMRFDDRSRLRTSASESESMDTGAARRPEGSVGGVGRTAGRQAHRPFSYPNLQQNFFPQMPFVNGKKVPVMTMPPPPPPAVFDDNLVSDNEALTSMLMAWYMSGYHTGFYQGLQQGRQHGTKPSHR